MEKCKRVIVKNETNVDNCKRFIVHYYDGKKRTQRIVYILDKGLGEI